MTTMLRSLLALALFAWLLAAPAHARERVELERWLKDLDRAGLAMGTLAVSEVGAQVWVRSIGVAGLEPRREASAQTRYRIGSVSKLFTAVLVLQLVEEGRLTLETPLARFFPTFPQAGRITVEQLLAHRSGIGDIQRLPGFDSEGWMYQPRSREELLQAIAGLPREFEPDARSAYNNSGHLILGWIVEAVEGRPLAEVLQRRIVQPLGLRETGHDPQDRPHALNAASHRPGPEGADGAGGGWVRQRDTHASVALGSGAFRSSPRDLVVFIRALFEGQGEGALLRPATLQRMQTLREGIGLSLFRLPGGTDAQADAAWGHEGLIDGSAASVFYVPARRLAVAWCGNGHRLSRDEIVALVRGHLAEPAARLPDYRPRPVLVRFAVDMGPAGIATPPAAVGLRGSLAPLSWQRSVPMRFDAARAQWVAEVEVAIPDGLALEYKYLVTPGGPRPPGAGAEERWERSPNRRVTGTGPAGSAAAVAVERADRFDHDAERSALVEEVLAADARLFGAFNQRDLAGLRRGFSERLEFFHDRNGLAGHAETMAAFESNFSRPRRVRRELMPGTTEVFPLGRFGALHNGSHRFCSGVEGAEPECGAYRFSHVWERSPDGWKLLRVISIDH